MECIIELNWLCKHIRKVRSSQPAILLFNWIKHFFPMSAVNTNCKSSKYCGENYLKIRSQYVGRFISSSYKYTKNLFTIYLVIELRKTIKKYLVTEIARNSCTTLFSLKNGIPKIKKTQERTQKVLKGSLKIKKRKSIFILIMHKLLLFSF